MRAALAVSYDLLDAHEQRLVRRLSVFVGGCTLEAAEAVCEAGDVDLLDAITSLVNWSLLRRGEHPDGQVRFTMLEVIREFGLEQLDAQGEADAVRLAHARHYLAFAEESAQQLRGEAPETALKLLRLEYANLRLALEWLLERVPAEGVRLAVALGGYWAQDGLYSEGYEWIRRALDTRETEPSLRVSLMFSAGELVNPPGFPGDDFV
jgi:predicted ATPase